MPVSPLKLDILVSDIIVDDCNQMVGEIDDFLQVQYGFVLGSLVFRDEKGNYYIYTKDFSNISVSIST